MSTTSQSALQNPFDVLYSELTSIKKLLEDYKPTPVQLTEAETFIDLEETSRILKVSTVTIWQWEKRGILKSYRIGNLKRFKLSEVLHAPKLIVRRTRENIA